MHFQRGITDKKNLRSNVFNLFLFCIDTQVDPNVADVINV